jgi:fructosamine-3-kinase
MQWMIEALKRILPLDPQEEIATLREVSGGDIGRSFVVETRKRKWFVKYRSDLPALVFQREAEGLALLREAGALAVPETVHAGGIPGQAGGMIVLEWIESGPASRSSEEALGRGLAELHLRRSPDAGSDFTATISSDSCRSRMAGARRGGNFMLSGGSCRCLSWRRNADACRPSDGGG